MKISILKNPDLKYLSEQIKAKAKEFGFYSCGISKATFLPEDAERLRKWLQNGKHAEMKYMENHFEKRTDPTKLLDGAKSVISVLFNYYPEKKLPEQNNYKISKYAYGTDYHFVMKRKLKELIAFINSEVPEIYARAFVDSAPVLDRAWAAKSGLGWIGKNTCLITKEQGSYFFIGEIIMDLELDYDEKVVPNHCGGCTRCIDACPTDALEPYSLDSNKCISNWTIEIRVTKFQKHLKENSRIGFLVVISARMCVHGTDCPKRIMNLSSNYLIIFLKSQNLNGRSYLKKNSKRYLKAHRLKEQGIMV